MEILTIGIDGGDEKILRAMPMPNLHKILNQNVSLQIEEDLWSRGWVKILCGTDSKETGAFYERPVLGRTRTTTQKFSTSDYTANPNVTPLWEKLNQKGHSVGFMNVPSMFPAPDVNGFVVSGGGAGSSTSGASMIPTEGYYPSDIGKLLESSGYILDTRLVASGISDIRLFLDRLIEMTKKRTQAYKKLLRYQPADIGFIVYRSVCVIQYLAMSEIESLLNNDLNPENKFQENIISFYQFFDTQINDLVEALDPKNIIFVSDHGQSPFKFKVNLNAWLQKNNFQTPLANSGKVLKQSIRKFSTLLPQKCKQIIKQTAPKATSRIAEPNANWPKTKAFSMTYVPGIYINDCTRFGGICSTDEAMSSLIEKIIVVFNQDKINQQHGLKAMIYRQEFKNTKYEASLPDIWIEHDDSYLFGIQGSYITANKNYGPISSLEGIDRDVYTGVKGRNPLLSVSSFLAERVKLADKRDLTLAYKLIVRAIEEKHVVQNRSNAFGEVS